MRNIVIIGTGGLAREFTSFFHGNGQNLNIVGYASSSLSEHSKYNLPGRLFREDLNPDVVGTYEAVIAIGNPAVRKKISHELMLKGFTFPAVAHSTSVVSPLATLGEGVIISPQCVIGPNVNIGPFSYINFCCGIGHDATLGAFCQINPGSQLGGNSEIGECVLVGSGSIILQRCKIRDDAIIGAGSVVFGAVPKGATVMGNPARRLKILEGDHQSS